jgi:hypothetical protein
MVQRDSLSVFDGFEDVEAFANNFARGTDNYTTNQRPRTNLPDTFRSQLERTSHHAAIGVGPSRCRFTDSCSLHF